MIHTASLLHDDVIDESDTRRGVRSVNAAFGNKVSADTTLHPSVYTRAQLQLVKRHNAPRRSRCSRVTSCSHARPWRWRVCETVTLWSCCLWYVRKHVF